MIRLECMIDDSKVAAVMYAVSGLVRDPQWLPVVNAAVKKDKVVALTKGTSFDMAVRWLATEYKPGDRINTRIIRSYLTSAGFGPDTVFNVAKRLKYVGMIKSAGKHNEKKGYIVLGGSK